MPRAQVEVENNYAFPIVNSNETPVTINSQKSFDIKEISVAIANFKKGITLGNFVQNVFYCQVYDGVSQITLPKK